MATMARSPVARSWKKATCSNPSASTMSNTPATPRRVPGGRGSLRPPPDRPVYLPADGRPDRAVAPPGAGGRARGRGCGPGDHALAAGPARLGAPAGRRPRVPRQHHLPPAAERALHRAGDGARAGDRADHCSSHPADDAPQGDARQLRLPGRVGHGAAGADPGAAGAADGSGGDDDARDHIRDRLRTATDGQRAVLRADGLFPLMLDQFTDQFVLATLVHDPPGTQRIVKFSYEELGDLAPEPWPRAPLAALCWIPRQAASAAESLFSAESYHFEGDMPAGIDVPVASLWVGATEDDMACVDLDTGGHLRIALRAAGFERGVAEVRWSLRPAPRGWLRTAWIATSLSALTLAVGAWRIDTITAGTPDAATRTQLAAAVILTLIGTLGGLVARIEEHPLVSRLLEWPRRLAGVAALLPFLAAGTLVVGPAGTSRRVLWALLAAMGVAIAGIFTVAFARPDTAADRPPPSGAGADGGG